jgi:hypothetical protein
MGGLARGLCNLPTTRLLLHAELMTAYTFGGEDAVAELVLTSPERYGL